MQTERVGAIFWDNGKIWDKCPKFRKCGRDIQALMTSFPPFTSGELVWLQIGTGSFMI